MVGGRLERSWLGHRGGRRTQVKPHMFYMTGFVEAHRTFGEAFHMLF